MSDLPGTLPAFLLAVLVIASTPGPAVALIIRRAAVGGFRRSVPLVLGIEAGLFVWALLAATGIAALIAVSEVAYLVLRVGGAIVLGYLGVTALRAAWRARREGRSGADTPVPDGEGAARPWRAFAEGAVTNLANPKAAIFMIAFFPQFLPAGAPVLPATLTLATIQVAVETCLYLAFAAGVGRVGGWLRSSRVRTWLEAVSGTVLLALGVRVALTPR